MISPVRRETERERKRKRERERERERERYHTLLIHSIDSLSAHVRCCD